MPELDRRDFLKLVGVGAGAAAAAGCDPVEKLVPYVIQPESITPGISVDYASTCLECSAACGLHVKTREGRPIKLEGNPDHPINQGRLCARGQVGLARPYHPDRYAGPQSRTADGLSPSSWEDGSAALAAKLKASGGKTWILGGPVGPSLSGVIDQFAAAAGVAGRLSYEPFDQGALRAANKALFGVAAVPIFDLSNADVILDLGSDFLDTGLSPTEHARQFADGRDIEKTKGGGSRLISVGPRLNLTVTSADRWIATGVGAEGEVARAIAKAIFDKKGAAGAGDAGAIKTFLSGASAAKAGISQAELDEIVDGLLHAKHPVALPPGVAASGSNATATAAAVMTLNALLGAIGSNVIVPAADDVQTASLADIQKLVAAMNAGQVSVLLIHDSNPIYSLPGGIGFSEALAKVGFVVSFASMADETAEAAHLVLPDHTPMESWGDVAPRSGIRSLVQPTLRPLVDSQSLGDTLLAAGRALGGTMPAGSFKAVLEQNWSDTNFRDALGRGGVFTAAVAGPKSVQAGLASLTLDAPKLAGSGDKTLVAFPHSFMGDGSGASLPWLQETPDPVTKVAWNSWLEMSFATAEGLGVVFGDVVEVTTDAGSAQLSAFPRGGIQEDVIAIPIGQGHTVGHYASLAGDGEPGQARGINAYALLSGATNESGGTAFLSNKATLRKTGEFRRLALSQWTDNQRGRGLAPAMGLAAATGHGDDHHAGGHHDEPPHTYDPAFDSNPDQEYRWGMVIDNDRCNGCSACVTACAIENNIPVVGEAQAIMHRDMSWMRIERYIGDGDRQGGAERRPFPDRERLGEVEVRHLPTLCQQCGSAPCEAVCPAIATYHTDEGLNGMVYNRCIGTRYCANNCTYKVRRFNYWDYGNRNFPGALGLMLNPDVTVRQQGVMEKCSFCVQRIEAARQPAKDEGRLIRDGEVQSACQQSCPAGAISFGNTKDEQSEVTKAGKGSDRSYALLQELNTRPGITYLAQVTREDHEGSH